MSGRIKRQELDSSIISELDKSGNLDSLATEDKSSLVGAVNEVDGDIVSHKADIAAHNATSLATLNTIILRDSQGRAKVNNPFNVKDIVNITEEFRSNFTTGQNIVGETVLNDTSSYLLLTNTGVSSTTSTRGMYLISIFGIHPDTAGKFVDVIKEDASISVTINSEAKVVVANATANNRTVRAYLIKLGAN